MDVRLNARQSESDLQYSERKSADKSAENGTPAAGQHDSADDCGRKTSQQYRSPSGRVCSSTLQRIDYTGERRDEAGLDALPELDDDEWPDVRYGRWGRDREVARDDEFYEDDADQDGA